MDEKVSVIIPTVQKNNYILKHLIQTLNKDNAVDEILLINNAIVPIKPKIRASKLKIITPEENLYVNLSWNYGVSLIKNDIFFIVNDDIACCENLCSKIIQTKILDMPDTGFVGIHTQFIRNPETEEIDDTFFDLSCDLNNLFFTKLDNYLYLNDWGSAFFGRKSNYNMIPDDFKIIYGDNYLLYKNVQNNKVNYAMAGIFFNHVHSQSCSSPEFESVVSDDITNGERFFNI